MREGRFPCETVPGGRHSGGIIVFLPLAIAWFVWAILFLANHPTDEICT